MGRGFESHRGHQKESQMTCNEPFGFFVVPDRWLFPCGANANYANCYTMIARGIASALQLVLSQGLLFSHVSEGVLTCFHNPTTYKLF